MAKYISDPVKFQWLRNDETKEVDLVSYPSDKDVLVRKPGEKGVRYPLAKGKTITKAKITHGIEGKPPIEESTLDDLTEDYEDKGFTSRENWQKVKGLAQVLIYRSGPNPAEVHWYQYHPDGEDCFAVDLKIKKIYKREDLMKEESVDFNGGLEELDVGETLTKENFFDNVHVLKDPQIFTEGVSEPISEKAIDFIRKVQHFIEQKDVDGFVCLVYGPERRALSKEESRIVRHTKMTEGGWGYSINEMIDDINDLIEENPTIFSERAQKVLAEHNLYYKQRREAAERGKFLDEPVDD